MSQLFIASVSLVNSGYTGTCLHHTAFSGRQALKHVPKLGGVIFR
uniref:Uncharacterized protein n=1 Tax=Anguilla anguilla TaxID=7936 RepID=A0A0E9XGM6_ANGAN